MPQNPLDLSTLLAKGSPAITSVVEKAREHRLQLVVGVPVEQAAGGAQLQLASFGDQDRYFYPASSIKLLGAVASLIKLNEINRESGAAYGLATRWTIGSRFVGDKEVDADASNVQGGALTIGHDLRKLFLVSDNAAFNHCFEFVGPRQINQAMIRAGLASCRLWHRLSESHSHEELWQTRPVTLQAGDQRWPIAARDDAPDHDNARFADLQIGDAYMRGGERVDGPMSFEHKNAIRLVDLQNALAAVVRPDIDLGIRGFPELSIAQRTFLITTMGMLPRESTNPVYDVAKYPDEYVKSMLPGLRRVVPAEHLRVYNKTGRAYGFSIENAYVEDLRTGRGFFVAAVLYTNPNGVLNDDRYGYAETADPFLEELGEVLGRELLVN